MDELHPTAKEAREMLEKYRKDNKHTHKYVSQILEMIKERSLAGFSCILLKGLYRLNSEEEALLVSLDYTYQRHNGRSFVCDEISW